MVRPRYFFGGCLESCLWTLGRLRRSGTIWPMPDLLSFLSLSLPFCLETRFQPGTDMIVPPAPAVIWPRFSERGKVVWPIDSLFPGSAVGIPSRVCCSAGSSFCIVWTGAVEKQWPES